MSTAEKQLKQFLVIAPFSPSHDPVAASAWAVAQMLTKYGNVTCVLDDFAPEIELPAPIQSVRLSALRPNMSAFADQKRIYCLGNSFESLFALKLYTEQPGVVITSDGSYYELILSLFQAEENWPSNYVSWLTHVLGADGTIIGDALVTQRRLSDAIGTEIYDRTPLCLMPATTITLTDDQFFPFTAAHTSPGDATQGITALCIDMPSETITAAAADMQNLTATIRIATANNNDINISAQVAAADIVIMPAVGTPTPALSYALQSNKAIIVAGDGWQSVLSVDSHLRIDNTAARHQLIAAIGALALSPDMRTTLGHMASTCWDTDSARMMIDRLLKMLEAQPTTSTAQKPAHPPRTAHPSHTVQAALPNSTPLPDIIASASHRVSAALIGSVPSNTLVSILFPGVDLTRSPRFATTDLVAALSVFNHADPHSLLANLGFETPIVDQGFDKTPNSAYAHVHAWPRIRAGLRNPDYAVAFNCHINGVPTVHDLDPAILKSRYGIEINFHESLAQITKQNQVPLFDRVQGHIADSGLFWELDKAQHIVRCIMIVGIAGTYRLVNRQPTESRRFIVADGTATHTLDHNPVMLMANTHGILSFGLRAVDATGCSEKSMPLIKLLAETRFKLEWSSHD